MAAEKAMILVRVVEMEVDGGGDGGGDGGQGILMS